MLAAGNLFYCEFLDVLSKLVLFFLVSSIHSRCWGIVRPVATLGGLMFCLLKKPVPEVWFYKSPR